MSFKLRITQCHIVKPFLHTQLFAHFTLRALAEWWIIRTFVKGLWSVVGSAETCSLYQFKVVCGCLRPARLHKRYLGLYQKLCIMEVFSDHYKVSGQSVVLHNSNSSARSSQCSHRGQQVIWALRLKGLWRLHRLQIFRERSATTHLSPHTVQ